MNNNNTQSTAGVKLVWLVPLIATLIVVWAVRPSHTTSTPEKDGVTFSFIYETTKPDVPTSAWLTYYVRSDGKDLVDVENLKVASVYQQTYSVPQHAEYTVLFTTTPNYDPDTKYSARIKVLFKGKLVASDPDDVFRPVRPNTVLAVHHVVTG